MSNWKWSDDVGMPIGDAVRINWDWWNMYARHYIVICVLGPNCKVTYEQHAN